MSAALDNREAPPLGTTLAGRYQLMRFLGAGGMGAVYDAIGPRGDRVAVKVLLGAAAEKTNHQARFWREAQITSELRCPHIVPTYDFGFDEVLAVPFMVMPLMIGGDVAALIERVDAIHPTVAVRIFRQACLALTAAHDAGVTHRDIKPANLFLDQDQSGNVTVRVLDFGLARGLFDEDGALTQTGTLLGTPSFMSPEHVVDAREADARSDVWSLGVSLFKALSASLPFDASSFGELCIAINTMAPRWLQDVAPWIDPDLARAVHGCMIREQDRRCPSANELAAALWPHTGGSDEVNAAMFQPLDAQLSAHRAARGEPPAQWQQVRPQQHRQQPTKLPTLSQPPSDPLLGTTLAGRYQLLRCLGQGGMGTVYEAQTDDGSRCALKIIKPELAGNSSSARQRFVREAKAVTSIHSEHVVRVLDADTDPKSELPFLVMEMLCGQDLDQLIERTGPIQPRAAAKLFLQACRGLMAAHENQLVHRDVKPGNLFLHQQPNGELLVKVCDFGIVKQLGTEQHSTKLTSTGGLIGSPTYMSPEQATNAKLVDTRSDVWSLGASLYQALSGELPFADCETVGELILSICTKPVIHLQDRAPWVQPELVEIVHTAMQRETSQRFQTVAEMAQALEMVVGNDTRLMPAELLLGIDPISRSQTAERAAVSAGTFNATAISHAVAERPAEKRSVLPIVATVTAIAALVGGSLFFTLRNEAPSAPITKQTSPNRHEISIAVRPAIARVTVDGTVRGLRAGKLVLSGVAGDRFEVVATHGEHQVAQAVIIGNDGRPSVESIDVAAVAAAAASSAPATTSSSTTTAAPTRSRPKGPPPIPDQREILALTSDPRPT